MIRLTLPKLLVSKDNPDFLMLQFTSEEKIEIIKDTFAKNKILIDKIEEPEQKGSALIISKNSCSEVFIIDPGGKSVLSNEHGIFDVNTGEKSSGIKPPEGSGFYVKSQDKEES